MIFQISSLVEDFHIRKGAEGWTASSHPNMAGNPRDQIGRLEQLVRGYRLANDQKGNLKEFLVTGNGTITDKVKLARHSVLKCCEGYQ